MEHLTTETIEKYLKADYPYEEFLEISAHILDCRAVCQKRLNQIDPTFLELAESLENARIEETKYGKHFSGDEIEAYVTKDFGIEKRKQMNRHFTKCSICANKLKERDPDYLSSFIKDNLYHDDF